MLTLEAVRRLARASTAPDPAERTAVLTELGEPPDGDVIATALAGLGSSDRNVRVAMLRALAWYPSEEAAVGIVRGLRDPVRRVREVAAKSSRAFTRDADVRSALRSVLETDPDARVRRSAFGALAGALALPYGPVQTYWGVPDTSLVAYDVLRDLTELDELRPTVLFAALRARELTDDLRQLLEEIVRVGTKAEAVSATRALCGYRVARVEEFPVDERPRVKATADRASGDLWYWVPRNPS